MFRRELKVFNEQVEQVLPKFGDLNKGILNGTMVLNSTNLELHEYRKLAPFVLSELQASRKLVPQILKQVNQSNKQIKAFNDNTPAMLAELGQSNQTIAGFKATIDVSNQEAAKFTPVLNEFSSQIKQARADTPAVLKEMREIVSEADKAGKNASEGAVTGVIKGIFTSPINLLKDTGRGISNFFNNNGELTEADSKLLNDAGQQAILSGEKTYWSNDKSQNRGSIAPTKEYPKDQKICISVSLEVVFGKVGKSDLRSKEICRPQGREWRFK